MEDKNVPGILEALQRVWKQSISVTHNLTCFHKIKYLETNGPKKAEEHFYILWDKKENRVYFRGGR